METVPAKLTEKLIYEADELIKEGWYANKSELIRDAVRELIRKLKGITKEQDQEITKEVLSGVTANIPGLVRASFSMINNLEDVNRFVSAISEISGKDIGYYRQRYELDERTGEWRVK